MLASAVRSSASYRLIEQREIPVLRIGASIRIRRDHLPLFIEQR